MIICTECGRLYTYYTAVAKRVIFDGREDDIVSCPDCGYTGYDEADIEDVLEYIENSLVDSEMELDEIKEAMSMVKKEIKNEK